VCGLNNRNNYSEFQELVNNYDLLCFVESKTDNCDEIEIPDFRLVHMQNRKALSNRRSGGIVLYAKNDLAPHVKAVETESDFILWFEMKGCVFSLNDDVLCGIVYIPPENSRYSSPDAFNQIENELISLKAKSEYVCLLGDFNSRISNDDCIFKRNEKDSNELPIYIDEISDVYKLEQLKIPIKRNSMDTKKNSYGNMFIDVCKFNNLYIFNGRVGKDKHVGKFTCKDSSVVDYCMGTSEFLGLVEDFCVLPFSSLFSDVHCPLSITLKAVKNTRIIGEKTDNQWTSKQPRKWDTSKKDVFQQNININEVHELGPI
jgi:hypothetical protein